VRAADAATNPFPGPQPYRAADRSRFHGREELAYRLEGSVLANRCVTVYGPSGAGKSSLMQASVIPALIEEQRIRVVRIDGWPEGKEPTQWLADGVYADLGFDARPADMPVEDALLAAAQRAARKSPRIVLLYLDQVEQLLFPGRSAAEVEAFFAALSRLVDTPHRGLRVVLALREDYLGRFRDRLREHRRLLSHGFRVGPLTVGELSEAVCKAAASGEPPQTWAIEPMRALMLQVRLPGQAASDEAEAQAAYAQIVCRALFQQRAQGEAQEEEVVEAEPILRGYLETTLDELGALGPAARRLLEDHLVTADGSRTLRTEKELLRILPAEELGPILKALEGAAILHAEEHQGSRYFEIGHDWLARRVFEARQHREIEEEQRRREEEQRRREEEEQRRREEEQAAEIARERAEAAERLAKARSQRRVFAIVAVVALGVAAGAVALGLFALGLQAAATKAEKEARVAEATAKEKAIEASDARLLAGFRELKNSGQLAWGTKLLAKVQDPEAARGWIALASDALGASSLEVTLRGHKKPLRSAVWSHDGERVLSGSADGTARIWRADGSGDPIVLSGHSKPITAAAFSPDGARVLTASEDGTARIWSVVGVTLFVLNARAEPGSSVAWSPDGSRVVIASSDKIARVFGAYSGGLVELKGHTEALTAAAFFRDGARVLTASKDGTARIWRADGAGKPVVLRGPRAAILFAALSPDEKRVLTARKDGTAQIFNASGTGTPVVLAAHKEPVNFAAWSRDGTRVVTASDDKTARVWNADGTGEPVVLEGHSLAVTFAAFRPDGRYIATASDDQTARLWPSEGGKELVLSGHEGPVLSAAWSPYRPDRPDQARVLTAAAVPKGGSSRDSTARIWRPALLDSLPRERREIFYHSASIGADTSLIASAYDDKSVRLWRAGGPIPKEVLVRAEKGWVASAALSPDSERVATAFFDGTARVVGVKGQRSSVLVAGHAAAVRAVAWSPDHTRLVTVSDDKTARVVSADGKGEAHVLHGHEDGLTSAAWSPGGERIVTTSMDHTARVWPASGAGKPVVFEGHGGAVYTAAWSPDGAFIVTGSEDGTAQVWDAKSRAIAKVFDRGSAVLQAIWSGDRIAVSSRRGGVLVSNLREKGEIVLETQAAVIAMAFIDSGKKLFTVAADNTTRTFTIDVPSLREGLLGINADCLPSALRTTYLGEPEENAREGYAACEGTYSRTPFFDEGQGP
jgi:WD40 repeat protein